MDSKTDIALEGEKCKRVKMSSILIRHSLRLNRFESMDYHADWMISQCQIIIVKWHHKNRDWEVAHQTGLRHHLPSALHWHHPRIAPLVYHTRCN